MTQLKYDGRHSSACISATKVISFVVCVCSITSDTGHVQVSMT